MFESTYKKIYLTEKKLAESYKKLSIARNKLESVNTQLIASEENLRKQIYDLKNTSNKLIESDRLLNRAQVIGKIGNWEFDLINRTAFGSLEAFQIYGLGDKKGILPLSYIEGIVISEDIARIKNAMNLLIKENIKYDVTFRIIRNDNNEERYIHSVAETEYDVNGKCLKILGVIQDITETKQSEHIIRQMAYYDDLTNLPNRVFFFEELENQINAAKKNCTKLAVLFLNIDNFKRVNDSLGHCFGDELLKETSKRLKTCMEKGDTIARLSGDSFLMLIKDFKNQNEILPIIDKILNIFNEAFHIENSSINMTCRIGIAMLPGDGDLSEELVRNADIAMHKARLLGKNRYQFFNSHMKNELLRKLNIEVLLRKAIEKEEFILYYQPQFHAKTKKLRGFEALIRWNSPELGFLNPLQFISIAEETGLISAIDDWVLNTACTYVKKINEMYRCDITIAVNISPVQLKLTNFYSSVIQAIDKSGIKPCNLELEVTENILIDNFEFTLKILNHLRKYGVRLSLDDFGTGYSSLSYLKKLPINLLKIDKSFIDEINMQNPKNDFIESMISLIHKLDIEALAEGVEDKFQYDYLINSGIDSIQGYYLGKPMPEEEVDKALTGIWML